MKHKFSKTKAGFSLIEVLLSLMVISVGVVGISALMAGNIRTSINARDQIIASSLAQEGVELAKNIKDEGGLPWYITWSDIKNAMTTLNTPYDNCRIDSQAWISDFVWNDPAANMMLYLTPDGAYTHKANITGALPTKFFRELSFKKDVNNTVTATSYVTWNGTGFGTITGFPASCNVANKCVALVSVLPE